MRIAPHTAHLAALALTATVAAPVSALAHNTGHEALGMGAEIAHLLSDPGHLLLIGAMVAIVAVAWRALKKSRPGTRQNAD